MFFADKSGAILESKVYQKIEKDYSYPCLIPVQDGIRMLIQPTGFELPEDLEVPHSVPGSGSDMASVDINGGFSADFNGVTFQVQSK